MSKTDAPTPRLPVKVAWDRSTRMLYNSDDDAYTDERLDHGEFHADGTEEAIREAVELIRLATDCIATQGKDDYCCRALSRLRAIGGRR